MVFLLLSRYRGLIASQYNIANNWLMYTDVGDVNQVRSWRSNPLSRTSKPHGLLQYINLKMEEEEEAKGGKGPHVVGWWRAGGCRGPPN